MAIKKRLFSIPTGLVEVSFKKEWGNRGTVIGYRSPIGKRLNEDEIILAKCQAWQKLRPVRAALGKEVIAAAKYYAWSRLGVAQVEAMEVPSPSPRIKRMSYLIRPREGWPVNLWVIFTHKLGRGVKTAIFRMESGHPVTQEQQALGLALIYEQLDPTEKAVAEADAAIYAASVAQERLKTLRAPKLP